jgi:replication-associated recombination protein RarA
MQHSSSLPFEQISDLVKKITHLEMAKREDFFMEKKTKEKKHHSLFGALTNKSISESKINAAVKWVNKLWKVR